MTLAALQADRRLAQNDLGALTYPGPWNLNGGEFPKWQPLHNEILLLPIRSSSSDRSTIPVELRIRLRISELPLSQ